MAGSLFVIAAASGTGKTSLVNALLEALPHIKVSISHTTRPKRPSEEDGVNYFFVEPAKFQSMIDEMGFLEHAKVFGHHYGTSRVWIEEEFAKGDDVILEIDWQGAQQIKALYPDCVTIFILPPSKTILRERLQGRAQDAPEVIEKRLEEASTEISHHNEYDYIVVNDDFELALYELKSIILANRVRSERQVIKHKQLLVDLLA